jgi:hypothetical protein
MSLFDIPSTDSSGYSYLVYFDGQKHATGKRISPLSLDLEKYWLIIRYDHETRQILEARIEIENENLTPFFERKEYVQLCFEATSYIMRMTELNLISENYSIYLETKDERFKVGISLLPNFTTTICNVQEHQSTKSLFTLGNYIPADEEKTRLRQYFKETLERILNPENFSQLSLEDRPALD